MGSMRRPVDEAACGTLVDVGVCCSSIAEGAETSPDPGSGDTSQRSAPVKNVVGFVTWYDRYWSVWARNRSCGYRRCCLIAFGMSLKSENSFGNALRYASMIGSLLSTT